MEIESSKKPFQLIFENEDFAVLNKKRGIPTAPLKEGDYSLLTEFLKVSKLKERVIGKKEVEKGLLHRLDTATTGLVLIAKTQKVFDFFSRMQEQNKIEKEYTAYCDVTKNFPNILNTHINFEIKSSFLPCGKHRRKVKMIFNAQQKEYTTKVIIENQEKALKNDCFKKVVTCKCFLTQGYRHQVRCHLASIGFPILNDALYNTKYIEKHKETIEDEIKAQSYQLELYATKLTLPSPYSPNEQLSFLLPPLDKKNL
ncbi:MAG: pseudouridine synthase [Treponema sp.]